MTKDDIRTSIKEAERFIKKARECLKEDVNFQDGYLPGSKYSGAVRRSSLDLTRALAEMRKS